MAWEISMSPEGWKIARERLEKFSKEKLISAITDDIWETIEKEIWGEPGIVGEAGIDLISSMVKPYQDMLQYVPHDILVNQVLDLIERHNTCDNGGSSLWIDRQGIHKVFIGEKLSDGEILR